MKHATSITNQRNKLHTPKKQQDLKQNDGKEN